MHSSCLLVYKLTHTRCLSCFFCHKHIQTDILNDCSRTKFVMRVPCYSKLLWYINSINAAPPSQHHQNHCFYFHRERRHLFFHYVTFNCLMQKSNDIDASFNHKEVIFASMLLNNSAPAEWIPHIIEHSCSMLISWMLTPLSDLWASVHLRAAAALDDYR